MKSYFVLFAVLAACIALAQANPVAEVETRAVELSEPIQAEEPGSRVRRETCNLRACEQFCRRLGYPGGACINNGTKCDCDRW